ncbi:hypothetical protein BC834DRAFT_939102 [Gloeopeniophorella convolvens]|nr:hypothetical protein BC834DRAFT_939102 [Gloeopeniophorella convolvens]
MDPAIDPSLQNATQPIVPEAEPMQTSVPPSPRPPTDGPSALAPPPMAAAPESPPVERTRHTEPSQAAQESQSSAADRQLNVTDALSYLDAVKVQFHERPDVYNVFLDIMKDFKSQVIDTPGVIQRVANLFHGHPSLIQGFNTFLPVGYRIEVGSDSQSSEVITVTTPSGTMLQSTSSPGIPPPPPPAPNHLPPDQPSLLGPIPSTSALGLSNTPRLPSGSIDFSALDDNERQGLGPAMDYVQRIKTRFSSDPDTYKQFLEILSSHKSSANNAEVFAKVEELFKDAPDLSSAFRDFLPGAGVAQDTDNFGAFRGASTRTSTPAGEHSRSQKRKQMAEPAPPPPAAPAKRRRKAADKDKEKERETGRASGSRSKQQNLQQQQQQHAAARELSGFSHYSTIPAPPSPRRSGHSYSHHAPPPPMQQTYSQQGLTVAPPSQSLATFNGFDETQFFPRVKAALDSRETYHEFLKLVNLFTQNFIDRARLVRESRSFLGDGELMAQFKDILGWDEATERAALAREREELYLPPGRPVTILDRPSREELNIRYGSYRRLPPDEINVECSGRDEMCRSVLNDEWVSHPSFSSEDSVFMAHKKNVYEEALHRSEEERHEYDFHIDALVRTISALEPMHAKIMTMSHEDRVNLRGKAIFTGSAKAVNQRIIKKIYGREAGLDVLQAMYETPAHAVPVVLLRLKQKEAEWKRAQREWNKVWRAVDAANYARSLDHQGITFKAADKKALTAKAFVAQIEAIMETQMARRAALVDPLFARARPQHQLAYELDDPDVLKDALKLAFSYLARLSGTPLRLDATRKGWIETRLYSVVRVFFQLTDWDEQPRRGAGKGPNAHPAGLADTPEDAEPSPDSGALSPRARNGAVAASFSGDLRKSLLKAEQAKSTRGQPSPMSSRMASPAPTAAADEERPRSPAPLPASIDPTPLDKRKSKRRSFFTNTWFYTLLRLVEVLYSRLHLLKNIAIERVNDPSFDMKPPTPMDAELAQAAGDAQQGRFTAAQYYDLMLETCERLFDNQIDQFSFEDQMREMFGLHDAYKIFTIDKVLAVLIKHVQGWEQDPKLEKIAKLLWDERRMDAPTVEDHRKLRHQAEEILGPEENLFRIDWLPESKTMTCQLLSKDGSSLDDAEVLSGRWQAYVEGFVSDNETPGVSAAKVRRPFLRRSLPPAPAPAAPPADFYARGALEIKVCVRTYRLFYVSHTEDVLWRLPTPAERERAAQAGAERDRARGAWLKRFRGGTGESAEVQMQVQGQA